MVLRKSSACAQAELCSSSRRTFWQRSALLTLFILLPLATSEEHSVRQLSEKLDGVVSQLCTSPPSAEGRDQQQRCSDAKRFQEALQQSGIRLSPRVSEPWNVLEGEALRQHPDPLGALQRGEVPALMLRKFVPEAEVDRMLSRMAQVALHMFSCRFPANVTAASIRRHLVKPRVSNDPQCIELNSLNSASGLQWSHWCALLTNTQEQCNWAWKQELPECKAVRDNHALFGVCAKPWKPALAKRRKYSANEFGQKMYGNLSPGNKRRFMGKAGGVDAIHDLIARGCNGPWCSPKRAMLSAVARLAGTARPVQQAAEESGQRHSPGTIRAMRSTWYTPFHMDSKHSSAWAALRKPLCDEHVKMTVGTSPREAAKYGALMRHHFAASAILTLHAPDRKLNPYDLSVFRTRWPALLHNCSVQTVDAYGVGVRFNRTTMPDPVLTNPLKLRADPGDLFLFNSEYFHDTPTIRGEGSRTVFNSFAGYSSPHGAVEVYA